MSQSVRATQLFCSGAGYVLFTDQFSMSFPVRAVLTWLLRVLLAVAFVVAGGFKFGQQPEVVSAFGSTGLPGWFFYVIAGAEVLGGLALLVPRLMRPAAWGLLLIMLGAVFMHATRIPGGRAGGRPSLILLGLLGMLLALPRRPGPVAG